ncbi:MAG: hypothetical protein M3R65_00475 [Gemmatimonadota bacterium]|nr:hypothetical protein [Gemmatimonadota bacterium]
MPTRKKTAKSSERATRKSTARTTERATKTAGGASKPATKRSTKPASKLASTSATKPATKSAKTTRKSTSKLSAAEQLREYQRKRDFEKTAEPSGATTRKASREPAANELRFVIQKHAATRLHYDLRLEMDGVMKSWAVPKGPSADPSVKRLAMQVEDHPIEYNDFEGTIPAGEYGGGTVMLWDNGTYAIENAPTDDQNAAAHDAYERGELKLDFHGKRIKGSYALVRTGGMGGNASKPSWLLIKHRDDGAHPESEWILTEKHVKSVESGRTMDQISKGSRVWHSSAK